jgi:hypothetical protein
MLADAQIPQTRIVVVRSSGEKSGAIRSGIDNSTTSPSNVPGL